MDGDSYGGTSRTASACAQPTGYVASGATLGIEDLKRAFTTAASTQFGATGWTVLNAAGDRKYGDYDFWAVRQVGGVPGWTRVARYETRTGRVVRGTVSEVQSQSER